MCTMNSYSKHRLRPTFRSAFVFACLNVVWETIVQGLYTGWDPLGEIEQYEIFRKLRIFHSSATMKLGQFQKQQSRVTPVSSALWFLTPPIQKVQGSSMMSTFGLLLSVRQLAVSCWSFTYWHTDCLCIFSTFLWYADSICSRSTIWNHKQRKHISILGSVRLFSETWVPPHPLSHWVTESLSPISHFFHLSLMNFTSCTWRAVLTPKFCLRRMWPKTCFSCRKRPTTWAPTTQIRVLHFF